MDLVRLLGAVIAVLIHPGPVCRSNGQRICRRGTERPCYKVSYTQDARRRLTFEEARQACRSDGGDLLSIETEGEQRLMERFIQQLHVGDGDFWIGLRRGPQRHRAGSTSPACPSQYYWMDGSKAKFRNWHWDEPSCGAEMCAVLYHQPSAPPDEEGHFLFQWNDDNCNSKNNFVCKYTEEKVQVFTEKGKTAHAVPTLRPNIFPTTESDNRIKIVPESSVSISEDTAYVSYILYATIPALLLLLFAAAGFFCYRQHTKRRKTEEEERYPSRLNPWLTQSASPYAVQGPYAFSDISKLPPLDGSVAADIFPKNFPHAPAPPRDPRCDEYENVSCAVRESGFVNNDIYETCRGQSRRGRTQTQDGWVENEIYG